MRARVAGGAHDRGERLVRRRERNQPRQVVGRRDVRGIEPGGIGEAGALEAELDRLLVHPLDEGRGAAVRHARERAGGGVVGGDQREVQDVVQRDAVVGAEIGGRGGVDVAALDGDFLREVGVVFEEDQRGHHLGDAGDRALVLRVLFPEHLAGLGIEDDGGGGADIRDQRAGRVGLEPGAHRLLERLRAWPVRGPWRRRGHAPAGPCGPARPRPSRPACSATAVREVFFRVGRFSRGGRDEDTKSEQQREQSSYVQRADQTHVSSDTTAAGWDSTVVVNWNANQCSNNAAPTQPEL